MTSNPHYFIGIKANKEVRKELEKWQQSLAHHMDYKTWTSPLDLHITLKFLGACTDEQIKAWKRQLSSQEWPFPFPVRIGPAGSFGKQDEPRVFHAKVSGTPALYTIKEQIEEIGKDIGFAEEKREYNPHITLAKKRVEGKSPLSHSKYESIWDENYSMLVDKFSIYRIHPSQAQKYEEVEGIGLNGEV